MQKVDKLRGFVRHGVRFTGSSGNNSYGDCPLCGKDKKFYANPINQMWDCKSCGKNGNFKTFLKLMNKEYSEEITPRSLSKLAENRGLPTTAFRNWGIGKNGTAFTIAVKNENGGVQDIRSYKLGQRIMGTPGCNSGMLGIDRLAKDMKRSPVYICEGEWDGIAMDWLLKKLNKKALIVATPGANTFKTDWIRHFQGRDVYVLYDHDNAGEDGEITIKGRLTGCAKSIKYLNWTDKFPSGFDIRDLITREAVKGKRPKRCFRLITQMLQDEPRKKDIVNEVEGEGKTKLPIDRKMTVGKVKEMFGKWLYKPDLNAVEVAMATVISNELQGDPVWLFLVASPGASKTEICSSFDDCSTVYTTSSLTPHALISGAITKNGMDPSMIPKLDGKTLIVKDWTTIISKRENERDEIFGIFRDAYDGKCGKDFGIGLQRYYESHFSILAGVTPAVYELSASHSGLGERFLKYFIGSNLDHGEDEEETIRKAMRNVNTETNMRGQLAYAVRSYVELTIELMNSKGFKLPKVPKKIEDEVIALAQFGSRMRASVGRDRYSPDMVTGRPFAEIGTRLSKQLIKLMLALAIINRHSEVTEHELAIIRKMVLDTIPQRTEDIIRTLVKSCPTMEITLSSKDVSLRTRYPGSTVSRLLHDMNLLKIVKKTRVANKDQWTVTDYIRGLLKRARLYVTQEELNRPLGSGVGRKRVKLRLAKRNK